MLIKNKVNNSTIELEDSLLEINSLNENYNLLVNIVNKGLLDKYEFTVNEKDYSIENTVRVNVNCDQVGVFEIFFDKETFKKEEVIDSIQKLKEIKIIDQESANAKVKALLEICDAQKSLIVLFKNDSKYIYKTNDINSLLSNPITLIHLYFKEEIKEEKIEISLDENPKPKKIKEKKIVEEKKDKNSNGSIFDSKYFPYIFSIIISLITCTTINISYLYVLQGQSIAIFYIIISVISAIMTGISIEDVLNVNGKYKFNWIVILTTLAGVGCGVGIYSLLHTFVFKPNIEKTLVNIFTQGTWITVVAIIVSLGIVIGFQYLIKYIKHKKSAK